LSLSKPVSKDHADPSIRHFALRQAQGFNDYSGQAVEERGVIVQSWPLYTTILWAHWVIYLGGPIVLFWAGWPILGGLVMLAATVMPVAGQIWFTDSEAPGLGFLMILEVPPAILVLLIGVGLSTTKLVRKLRTRR
jgi:hypothetical protein